MWREKKVIDEIYLFAKSFNPTFKLSNSNESHFNNKVNQELLRLKEFDNKIVNLLNSKNITVIIKAYKISTIPYLKMARSLKNIEITHSDPTYSTSIKTALAPLLKKIIGKANSYLYAARKFISKNDVLNLEAADIMIESNHPFGRLEHDSSSYFILTDKGRS